MSDKNPQNENTQESQTPMQQNKVVKLAWDEKRCKKFASRFDTLEDWATGHQSSYKAAVAHGWVESCSKHMTDTSLPENLKTYKPTA